MTHSISSDALSPQTWPRALWQRCRMLWLLKLAGNTVATLGFFPLYFWVMHNAGPAWVLPLTAVDKLIAFWPAMLPVYLTLWAYIALPVLLAKDRRELNTIALGCAVMTAIALAVFWWMPTAIPNFAIDAVPGSSLHFLKTFDAAGNAFPSLHVSFSVFACLMLARQLRGAAAPGGLQLLNVVWAVAIVYSTMAVRQHVLIDVLGGLGLGLATGFALRERPTLALAPVAARVA